MARHNERVERTEPVEDPAPEADPEVTTPEDAAREAVTKVEQSRYQAEALPRPQAVGDVKAVALKTNNHVQMGGRTYQLQQGHELLLDPSHAQELEANGWVMRRKGS